MCLCVNMATHKACSYTKPHASTTVVNLEARECARITRFFFVNFAFRRTLRRIADCDGNEVMATNALASDSQGNWSFSRFGNKTGLLKRQETDHARKRPRIRNTLNQFGELSVTK